MKPIDFIKLIIKHKVVLIVIPLIFGMLSIIFTSNPKRSYYSQTILYTGIASGSSIQMDKTFNYLATNNAFDNLINIIKSRETKEEVAIRLLSQHLMLNGPNQSYISSEAYNKLMEILPEDIKSQLINSNSSSSSADDNLKADNLKDWNDADYEATVILLTELMLSNNSNFVYSLLNFDHPYYSLEAISKVKAERISASDLVKLSYETDDPGICQQTLAIYNEVCIKKYKDLKENGSDAVVKYFESQLKQSEDKLKGIEQKLLKFNQDNNIINYYEQSKAVAIVKEDMDVEYGRRLAQLEGSKASAKRLEEKLQIQELIQEKNNTIIDSKKKLGEINYRIGIYEAKASKRDGNSDNLKKLREEAKSLQKDIKTNVDEIYSFQNSIEGVPIKKALPDWVDKEVETEDLKAKLEVMDDQNKAIEKQFAMYAPAGANLKRIEREIEVAEQEYLEILHGLNLAKLKFQDTQLSSNLKAVDPPYFPLNPMASKRKLIIIAILLLSGIIVLGVILFMEFFDDTLKNDQIASEKLGILSMGMLPKVFKSNGKVDLIKIQDRLMEFFMQNFNYFIESQPSSETPKIITVFSTKAMEGKSIISSNIAKKLKASGKSVVVLNHANSENSSVSTTKSTWLYKMLGYDNPSIDYSHPFLEPIDDFLDKAEYQEYKVTDSFRNIINYQNLDFNKNQNSVEQLDYVIIELPNILETNYPSQLISKSDLGILVCRSNRLWSKADGNILKNIKEILGSKLQFIINGVEIKEVENLLGELPKKRSNVRRTLKNILRFQFYTNDHI